MCLNVINFDVVDFSERRSEEVMSLLTLSLFPYYTLTTITSAKSDRYRSMPCPCPGGQRSIPGTLLPQL